MRDKHLHIPKDSELLRSIYKLVDEQLIIQNSAFKMKLFLKFLFYIGASCLFYSLIFLASSHLILILSYIGYGFSTLLFAFNFAHDLSHNTVFQSKKQNNFFFILIYSLLGAHGEAWKYRHVHSHHYAPNVKDYDSDLRITKLIRVIPLSEKKWYHRFQHWYAPFAYTTYSLFWIFIKDFVILFSKDEYTKKKGLKYHLSFWIQKSFYVSYLVIIPMIFLPFSWVWVFTAFIAMHLSQSLFLLFTFFMTHHVETSQYPTTDENGTIQTSWIMNQIRSSNDMHPFSEVANFIFGGFNNHIAHHLFPHIHHLHYPKLNKILYHHLEKNSIFPNKTTYFGGIASHLRHLKKMGI
jgi:linoleoyl-CoA desaturase